MKFQTEKAGLKPYKSTIKQLSAQKSRSKRTKNGGCPKKHAIMDCATPPEAVKQQESNLGNKLSKSATFYLLYNII